jgi:sugar/nucleoside kinase (ribokinase family)
MLPDNMVKRYYNMGKNVLILNTAVTDLRRPEFDFTDKLVGKGGLAKCKTEDMPSFSQEQIAQWIREGSGTAGGPGNSAPLMARAGLGVAVGVILGLGNFETSDRKNKLDAQGTFFYDEMVKNEIDMSGIKRLQGHSGITFIHDIPGAGEKERGGIAYFPGLNDLFGFSYAKNLVSKFQPNIVYYMYSGLSDSGDTKGGKALARFMRWCRQQGCITIADSHTLTANPSGAIREGREIAEYRLLEPLFPELDIFCTSDDEGKLMANVVKDLPRTKIAEYEAKYTALFVEQLSWKIELEGRTRLCGVTVSDGAHYAAVGHQEDIGKVTSKFMPGEVVDLVGAGDAFRAGLITYIARNIQAFRDGTIRFDEAIQMGNLFAALYIKAPLHDRYVHIRPYETLLEIVKKAKYESFTDLKRDLGPVL